jgi:predicted porin
MDYRRKLMGCSALLGAAMTKLGIFAATILAAAGATSGAWAADAAASKAAPASTSATPSASAPKTCTGVWDFIETDCQLTWYGITLYGAIDAGFTYQTHGAPLDPRSPPGSAYIVQRYSQGPRWSLAPNGLQNSYIGIKGTEPIGWNTSVVFALDAGFDPYSLKLSSGPGSAAHNAGIPQNLQSTWADSSRAGQFYNGNGYVGVSSPTYGTLTVFRQNSLTYDGVLEYDPMGASYAFSPIGWQGITCGGGNTENCRHTTSLKYRLNIGQARVAAIWQFGGYGQDNASNGAYQFGVGGDIPHLANGVLSVDAIYSYVKDSVSTAVLGGSTDANGNPIPPFLPAVLTATISDNRAVMLLARYTNGPLKLYAGFEQIRYSAPSDPQTAFTNVAGDFVCLGCQAFNNTNISNTSFGAAGLADRIFDIYWTGMKYAVTNQVDVIAAYYHYTQHSSFGTPTGGVQFCDGKEHAQCAGTLNAVSGVVDWRFAPKWDVYIGAFWTEFNGGLSNSFFVNNNVATTAGLRFKY